MNSNYQKKGLFIVTGATGWVGRNFLHELQKIYSAEIFNKSVLAFGSKKTVIKSTAYVGNQISIPIFPLKLINEYIENKNNLKIIHTAFLTREKISEYGIENYIDINKSITSSVAELLECSNNSEIVIISSGAARMFDNKIPEKSDLINRPYEYLKYKEEKFLSSKSNSIIMRIFALSGRFMKDPNLFAFGNFLLNAKSNKSIIIKSKNNVIRSYGYASDIAKLGINWLYNDKKTKLSGFRINAASVTINLLELAACITKMYSLPVVSENVDYKLEENNYSCKTNEFLGLLKEYNIKPTVLSDQIKETMKDIF